MAEPIPNPLAESTPETNVAPNLDSELDAALGQAFGSQTTQSTQNEEKTTQNAVQEEVKPTEKPVEKSSKPEESKVLPDPESIAEGPPGKSSSQSKDGWNTLRTSYKKAKDVIGEKDNEISKLKGTLAEKGTSTTKEVEELKSQIQELSKYRAMVDIQADPEFMSKYDEPISKSKDSLKSILKSMDVTDDVVSKIDFSNTKLMDEIIGHIEANRDKITANKFRRKVEDLVDLMDKRGETLVEWKENHTKFMEDKKKEAFSKGAEDEGRMMRHIEQVTVAKDKEGNTMFPFLNKIVPAQGAQQAEVDKANQHNKLVELMNQKVASVIKMKSPEEQAEVAIAAVSASYLSAQLRSAAARIASLEAEIGKIAKVNSEDDKTKIRAPNRNGNGPEKEIDLDAALAQHSWTR